MGSAQPEPLLPERAITDVFDDQRRTFLVRYPAWLIVAFSLTGVAAFALVGFFGFRDTQPELALTRTIFHEPWPIFLWFCALIMALQASVLRHRSLRPQMVAALVVTLICMLIVGASYYYNRQIDQILQTLLQQVLNIRQFVPELGRLPWLYTLLNFGLLAIFWADTLRRWYRGARGKPITPGVDIGLSTARMRTPEDQPTLEELISGDLIAAAVLALVLALIFRTDVINFLSDALQVQSHVTTCTVSWPIGTCAPPGGGPNDPWTLSFIDLIQALIYLPVGLLILAISATLSGLAAGEGVTTKPAHLSEGAAYDTGSSTGTVAEEVTLTLLSTLRSALNRRLKLAMGNAAISFRNVAWPALVLLGTMAVASAARAVQNYLHLESDVKTCGSPACPDYLAVRHVLTFGQPYLSMLLALVLGALAVVAISFSISLLVFSVHVAENTLKFLGLIGFISLLTFWIFSLAISGFNELLWVMHAASRWPFPQPGVATVASCVCLAFWGGVVGVRRLRRRVPGAAAVVPVAPGQRRGA